MTMPPFQPHLSAKASYSIIDQVQFLHAALFQSKKSYVQWTFHHVAWSHSNKCIQVPAQVNGNSERAPRSNLKEYEINANKQQG
jgi:hypothetical protein